MQHSSSHICEPIFTSVIKLVIIPGFLVGKYIQKAILIHRHSLLSLACFPFSIHQIAMNRKLHARLFVVLQQSRLLLRLFRFLAAFIAEIGILRTAAAMNVFSALQFTILVHSISYSH